MTKKLLRIPDSLKSCVWIGPAYQKGGPEFMRKLKAALDQAECGPGQVLPQKVFGTLLGVPKSTIHDWSEGALPDAIRALFCGLERLGQPQWSNLIRGFLRDCPRLDDQRLAHNADLTAALKTVLSQPGGLTLIQGASPDSSRFVFNAISNSIRRLNPKLRIGGIDVQAPEHFAGVPGVFYIRQASDREMCHKTIQELWRLLLQSDENLLLLNKVVTAAPEIWPDLVRASSKRQIILSDNEPALFRKDVRRKGRKALLLTVQPDHEVPGKLNLNISSLVVSWP